MTDLQLLRDLGMILVAAALLLLAARSLRVPSILAYIVAGLLLGPATGLLHPTGTVEILAEAGIALLLFLVGLELSLDKIRAVGKAAVISGAAQVALSTALGWALALALGLRGVEAALVGLALAFSSTVVVVKLLERRDELATLQGRLAIGILLVQDLVVAVALTLVAGFEGAESLGPERIAQRVGGAALGTAALVGVAYAAARWVLPSVMNWMNRSLEGLFIWSLTWCFAFILFAEALQLSVEIGAFVAGVSLAQLSYNHELVRRVHPLVNFFLAVFFVSLGVELDAAAALALWPAVLALSAFVLVAKPVLVALLVARFGYGSRPSFLTGLLLGQASEFSFILVGAAVAAGVVAGEVAALVALTGLVTIGVSVGLIEAGPRLYAVFLRRGVLRVLRGRREEDAVVGTELAGHIVVVGMNTLGRRLVQGFVERGELVLAVDTDPRKLLGLPCPALLGNTDHPGVLDEAGAWRAKLVVAALQIEDANALLTYRLGLQGVPISVHAFDPSLGPELEAYGASYLMVSKYDGIRQVAEALRREGVIA